LRLTLSANEERVDTKMQISANHSLYVVPQPTPRTPQALPSPSVEQANAGESQSQRPPVAQQPRKGLVTTVEAQQADIVRGRLNVSTAQNLGVRRALSEYQEVDAQPQRAEAAQVLGIDVYA
jgi:hypothetical protein